MHYFSPNHHVLHYSSDIFYFISHGHYLVPSPIATSYTLLLIALSQSLITFYSKSLSYRHPISSTLNHSSTAAPYPLVSCPLQPLNPTPYSLPSPD